MASALANAVYGQQNQLRRRSQGGQSSIGLAPSPQSPAPAASPGAQTSTNTANINGENPYTNPADFGPGGQYGPGSGSNAWQDLGNLQPVAPTINPQYSQLGQVQQGIANQYGNNLQQNQNDLANSALAGTRQQLASTIQGVQSGANARGLLYSGANIGGQAAARGAAAQQAAGQISQANQTGLNNLGQLQQNAINTGFGQAGVNTGQALAGLNYQTQNAQQALQNSAINTQFLGSLGGGLGSVAGAVVGSGLLNSSAPTMSSNIGAMGYTPQTYNYGSSIPGVNPIGFQDSANLGYPQQ
jgi:hypothetical protein